MAEISEQEELDALRQIVERVMTQHWDLQACGCWFCVAGRDAGCRPREPYLTWRGVYAYIGPRLEKPNA